MVWDRDDEDPGPVAEPETPGPSPEMAPSGGPWLVPPPALRAGPVAPAEPSGRVLRTRRALAAWAAREWAAIQSSLRGEQDRQRRAR